MECICHSKQTVKNGRYKNYQKYKCKNCSRQFTERSFSFFSRHRFPEEIIRNAILYTLFVSTRISRFMVQETMNFTLSHVTVFNWMNKFAHLMSKQKRRISFSNIWHLDEKFDRVKGIKEISISVDNGILAVN